MATIMTSSSVGDAVDLRPFAPPVQAEQPEAPGTQVRALRPRVPIGAAAVRAALGEAVDAAREGRSAALVVRGAPGSGRTLLLGDAAASAGDCQVLRSTGVEIERELPFGTLQRLCVELTTQLDALPLPQADALRAAFGLAPGPTPDPYLAGLGLVSLLSHAASVRPVVCLVDDVHWADAASLQALGFAARRLDRVGVAVLLAIRGDAPVDAFSGIDEVRIPRLSKGELALLLAAELPGRIETAVRDRMLDESGGLARTVVEVARSTSVTELAGGYAVPARDEVADADLLDPTSSDGARWSTLSGPVQQVLLLAALEPLGDPAVFRKALAAAGVTVEARRAAEASGLLRIGDAVRFAHPLVRDRIASAAGASDRRAAHAVLADVVPGSDHRAWHHAASCDAACEAAASLLEQASTAARRAAGSAAAGRFLARASALSEEPQARVRRALTSSLLHHRSGAFDDATSLVESLEREQLTESDRLLAQLVRAEVAASTGRRAGARDLTEAARRLGRIDPELSCETYLRALDAATTQGRLGLRGGLADVAASAAAARPWASSGTAPARLLDALATWWSGAEVADHDTLATALTQVCAAPRVANPTATRLAMELWDVESWETLADRAVDRARRTGEIVDLPRALDLRACLHVLRGELGIADALADDAARLARRLGAPVPQTATSLLRGWRCSGEDTLGWADGATRDATRLGDGAAVTALEYSTAVAHNAAGRYEQALQDARRVLGRDEPFLSSWAAAEVVEAAARLGRPEEAEQAFECVRSVSAASGSPWAAGIERRCAALLGAGDEVDEHFLASIRHLERAGMTLDLARTHLLYGEWLRRQKRRVDARTHLRIAGQLFDAAGAQAFAARASLELRASGEQARRRSPETVTELTERESQIAQLASEGCSNPEIGTQLFISSRTVEYHLGKVFSKLGISSRAQLASVMRPG